MNPRSFPNTREVLSNKEPEIVDMSLENSPASPGEAGANARSPSPTPKLPDYEPGEEADMLLDAAEAAEARARSPPLCRAWLEEPFIIGSFGSVPPGAYSGTEDP